MTTIDRSRLPTRSTPATSGREREPKLGTERRDPSSAPGRDQGARRLGTRRREHRRESGWQLTAMLGLVSVAGLYLVVAVLSPDKGLIAFGAFPVLVAAGLGMVHLLVRSTNPAFDLAGIAATGLALRFLGGYVRFSNPVDASVYHKEGVRLAASYRALDFTAEVGREIPGTGTIRVASGVLNIIAAEDFFLVLLLFTLASFAGACLFVRALQVGFPEADLRRYAMLVFLLPTLFFWPSSLGKEAWMLLGLGVTALGAAHLFRHAAGRGMAYLVLGLALTALVRPHVSILSLAAIGVGLLGTGTDRNRVQSTARVMGVVLLLIGGAVLSRGAAERLALENLGTEEISSARDRAVASTSQGDSAFAPVVANDPISYVRAFGTVLFRPFPGEVRSVEGVLASLEGVFVFGVLAASWRRFSGIWRRLRQVRYLLMSLAFTLGFVWAFSAIGNFGILTRQRSQVLPFLLVFAALPAVERVTRDRRGRLHIGRRPSARPSPDRARRRSATPTS